jgi:hypothetical protein
MEAFVAADDLDLCGRFMRGSLQRGPGGYTAAAEPRSFLAWTQAVTVEGCVKKFLDLN